MIILAQIYGLGKQTRSFQYVSDLVDGLIALMNSSYTLPVNLGNPIERTIGGTNTCLAFACLRTRLYVICCTIHLRADFAEIIRASVQGNSSLQYLPAVEDDPQRRKPDISRAKKYLNWEPTVNIVDTYMTSPLIKQVCANVLFRFHWNRVSVEPSNISVASCCVRRCNRPICQVNRLRPRRKRTCGEFEC